MVLLQRCPSPSHVCQSPVSLGTVCDSQLCGQLGICGEGSRIHRGQHKQPAPCEGGSPCGMGALSGTVLPGQHRVALAAPLVLGHPC